MTRATPIAESGVHGLVIQPEPDGSEPRAGLLAIPMVSGLNEQARLFGRRLAAAGLTVLVWDPYPGIPEDQLGRDSLPPVDDAAAAEDHVRCLDYLGTTLGLQRIGAIGWCMGGRMALTLAARDPRVEACVAYFPTLRQPRPPTQADAIAVADRIACPVQVLYGGQDHVTSHESFAALRAALERRDQPTLAHVYPQAEHGFLAEARQATEANRVATRLAWPQTLAFLRAALLPEQAQAPSAQPVGASPA